MRPTRIETGLGFDGRVTLRCWNKAIRACAHKGVDELTMLINNNTALREELNTDMAMSQRMRSAGPKHTCDKLLDIKMSYPRGPNSDPLRTHDESSERPAGNRSRAPSSADDSSTLESSTRPSA